MAQSRHKNSGISWHWPGEIETGMRKLAADRGVHVSAVLAEACTAYLEACGEPTRHPRRERAPRAVTTQKPAETSTAPHRCPLKGWCGVCQEWKLGR
jgi:hypothetical protein